MADEESLDLGDVGAGEEEGEPRQRAAGLSGLFIKMLKWGAIGLGFIILGVTTTVMTFRLVNKGATQVLPSASEKYVSTKKPLEYYDNIDSIRGVTADENPAIFSLRVSVGYKKNDKETNTELIDRRRELQNLILLYISTKKMSELTPEYYAQLQEELKQQVNRRMIRDIDEVTFREFVVTK